MTVASNARGGNFNSRSRTGSDVTPCFPSHQQASISIHAPAQGATIEDMKMNDKIKISIHAPAQGATFGLVLGLDWTVFQFTLPHRERPGSLAATGLVSLFQFTLPHRERQIRRHEKNHKILISIHAPAQGATPAKPKIQSRYKFQFTLPHRERPYTVVRR